MIMSRLTALAVTALLSSTTFAAGTGPTDPVEKPKSPAIQSAPGINTDGGGVDHNLPPSTGTDPRTQGNDTGRQGGMNVPDGTPDNAGSGTGSKTTTGGSGSEGGANQ
ncbi:Exported protein [Pseudomonas sp. IT-P12]|jgi:hypothetical protein|uniref:hypothetical protein n=1 Tax=Pseudomonas sp. IT-P12 TaxID=3026450 RepID=UPI0039DFE14F